MKQRNTLITVIFLAVIFLLPAATLGRRLFAPQDLPVSSQDMSYEELPAEDASVLQLLYHSMKGNLESFTDDLFFKKQLISINMDATSLLTGGSYFESTQVLLGKEGWLFYKADTVDEHPLQDYTGANRYTEEELAQIAANLRETQDYFLREWDVPIYFVSIPNKELLYSEYMPDTILRQNTQSREAQIIEYMKGEPDIAYFSLKEAFLEAKSDPCPLYYKTDTHWNLFGSYVGLQEIFEQVYGDGLPADSSRFHTEAENLSGDLAKLTGMPERFAIDSYYAPNGDLADPAQYRDETLLIIGDSFGDGLNTVATPYYRQIYYVHYSTFQADAMAYYDPDLVIWECVERYSDNLRDRRLMEQ